MPTSIGRMPVNEFCDKLSPSNWKERIVLGMAPVRLFSEIDKIGILLEFPKLDGWNASFQFVLE